MHLVSAVPEPDRGDPDAFALAVAVGLGDLGPADLHPETLTVPLLLSAWMHDARLAPEPALSVLLALRDRLLDLAVVDRRSEPVPLLAGDGPRALCSLAVYLAGLLRRVGAGAGLRPDQLADLARP